MDVHIGELTSTVRAVDDASVLSPAVMDRIVAAVLQAVERAQVHRERVHAERRVRHGICDDDEESR